MLGELIHGKYRVDRLIGSGGIARVYEAVHLALGTSVAIKVLQDVDSTSVRRFEREARIAAVLRHPNILEVHDFGATESGRPFLVTELLEGEELEVWLSGAPLAPLVVVELARQVAHALSHVHRLGIVHRDVKPQNIFVHRRSGHTVVKLLDFGISIGTDASTAERFGRVTCTDTVVGTPEYMAPEQIRGEMLDGRTDLYSLGAIMFEALVGRTPHDGDTPGEVVAAVLRDPIPSLRSLRPGCPAALAALVDRLLAHEPRDRYASALAVEQKLSQLQMQLDLPSGELALAQHMPAERGTTTPLPLLSGMVRTPRRGSRRGESSHAAGTALGPNGRGPRTGEISTWTTVSMRQGGRRVARSPFLPAVGANGPAWSAIVAGAALVLTGFLFQTSTSAEGSDGLPAAVSSVAFGGNEAFGGDAASATDEIGGTSERVKGTAGDEPVRHGGPAPDRVTGIARAAAQTAIDAESARDELAIEAAGDGEEGPPIHRADLDEPLAISDSMPSLLTSVVSHDAPRLDRGTHGDHANHTEGGSAARESFDGTVDAAFRAYAAGERERALTLYRRAASQRRDSAEAWLGLGQAAESLGHRDEARSAYERYLRLAPERDAERVRRRLSHL